MIHVCQALSSEGPFSCCACLSLNLIVYAPCIPFIYGVFPARPRASPDLSFLVVFASVFLFFLLVVVEFLFFMLSTKLYVLYVCVDRILRRVRGNKTKQKRRKKEGDENKKQISERDTHIARVWINRERLPVLHVVS